MSESEQLVQQLGARIAPLVAGQPVAQTAAALGAVLATILRANRIANASCHRSWRAFAKRGSDGAGAGQ